jgi:hypothetical protein
VAHASCRLAKIALAAAAFSITAPLPAQASSPEPWIQDLAQARQAFEQKYANIKWLEHDRDGAFTALFDKAGARLRTVGSDEEARLLFRQLIDRIGDGHVSITWPHVSTPAPPTTPQKAQPVDTCRALGFSDGRNSPGTAATIPGYLAVDSSSPLPSGLIRLGPEKIGVLRIGGFDVQGDPSICRAALAALHRPAEGACDDDCRDQVLTWSYDHLTATLEDRVRALRAAGATILLVDVSGNGGGTEWAEAAARILAAKRLTSERRGYVRGPHWSTQWAALAAQLRDAARSADNVDRAKLLAWADDADHAREQSDQPCARSEECALVAQEGYATGLVGSAAANTFAGKPWGPLVFSPAQFPYHDGVWAGPLLVLADNETWSAAEEFAAVLQDNGAAVILGSRTGGAGCGHTNGGTPTTLANSGAILELPDCVRYRIDGSNEVQGIIPDVLVGLRANDGASLKAKLVSAQLPRAVELAKAQAAR